MSRRRRKGGGAATATREDPKAAARGDGNTDDAGDGDDDAGDGDDDSGDGDDSSEADRDAGDGETGDGDDDGDDDDGDDGENEPETTGAVDKSKRKSGPRVVKRGDEVTLRRMHAGHKVLNSPVKVTKINAAGVASLKILKGIGKGKTEHGVKRYSREHALGPTDLCCPSWVADMEEIGA